MIISPLFLAHKSVFAVYAYIFRLESATVKYGNIFYRGKLCSSTKVDLSLYTPWCDVGGWKRGSVALSILNLGTRCRRVINFTLRTAVSLGKETLYPLNRRLNYVAGTYLKIK